MERIKDYLLLEEEFISNQERLKPELREEKNEADENKVDELRGTPINIGTLEEIIDDDHAIVTSPTGPEYYVSILSIVDKDRLEPGCSVLLHHKTNAIVGVLEDDADPMVSVMKLDKAPTESYADVGGLEQQIQEIKVCIRCYSSNFLINQTIGIRRVAFNAPGTIRRNGYQAAKGCDFVRCPRDRKDPPRKSCRKPNFCHIPPRRRVRAYPEIPW